MVQRPLQRPGEFPYQQQQQQQQQREHAWPGETRGFGENLQDSRFAPPIQPHLHPQSVEAALKDCARIPVVGYALFVYTETGEEMTYSSPTLTKYQKKFFNEPFRREFHQCLRRSGVTSHRPSVSEVDTDVDSRHLYFSGGSSSDDRMRHHTQENSDEDDSSSVKKRKLSRSAGGYSAFGGHGRDHDEPMAPVPTQKTMTLVISDSEEVKKFYYQRFKDMQQSSCKVMGKAFVKLLEPKKQTHHPYTKGNSCAPTWWPLQPGIPEGNENHVRHKEPDHLLKPERIHLLVYILRMLIQPAHLQHQSARKINGNVKKLEEATLEMMTPWFNDKEHPENATKKPFFKEIFKVAKAEERYLNGEIDGSSKQYVMLCGDRSGLEGSDEDDGEDAPQEDDDEHDAANSASAMSTSDMASPPMMQQQHSQPPHHSDADSGFRNRTLPVRGTYLPALSIDGQQSYDGSYMSRVPNAYPISPSPVHERRDFHHSPGYSPQNSIYHWSQPTMSQSSMMPNSYYTASPQNTLPPSYQLPPLPTPQPHVHSATYDSRFDGGPVTLATHGQFRTGSLSHPNQMPPVHGFSEYGMGRTEPEMKDESQGMYSAQ